MTHLLSSGIGNLIEKQLNLLNGLKITLKFNRLRILASLKHKSWQNGRATRLLCLILTSLKKLELQGGLGIFFESLINNRKAKTPFDYPRL